jgi:hypothetical protein
MWKIKHIFKMPVSFVCQRSVGFFLAGFMSFEDSVYDNIFQTNDKSIFLTKTKMADEFKIALHTKTLYLLCIFVIS